MKKLLAIALCCAALSAAPTLTVTKTPFEAFNLGVDFAPVIGADGIALVGIEATNVLNGQDLTGVIIAPSPAPAVVGGTKKIAFRVHAGSDGQQILLGVRASDSTTGEVYEGQIMLMVKAR